MLFLAVFCGFFAEYQLEHKIERDIINTLNEFYQKYPEIGLRLVWHKEINFDFYSLLPSLLILPWLVLCNQTKPFPCNLKK